MAEATVLRNAALPFPVYGAPYAVVFPLLDADGDPISPSAPDSERSLNGDTFADCTNEATEIATSSGICFLALTAAEMTADITAIRVQSTGAKTTVLTLYPRKLPVIRSGTAADDGSGTSSIVLDAGASDQDDFYNGMLVVANLDGTVEARVITDYVGSTKAATVVPDWTIAPDNSDTFTIYMVEGPQLHQANVTHFGGAAGTFSGGRPEVNTTHAAGTAWASGAITAAVIATGAIDADAIADNAIDAGAIAADAITAAKVAADVSTEIAAAVAAPSAGTIADAVWDEALEGSYSARELMRLYAAALGGKASGLDTGAPKYRNTSDDVDVIDATTDEFGNRSAVTLDLSDTP